VLAEYMWLFLKKHYCNYLLKKLFSSGIRLIGFRPVYQVVIPDKVTLGNK
jgi:hypothetical protein